MYIVYACSCVHVYTFVHVPVHVYNSLCFPFQTSLCLFTFKTIIEGGKFTSLFSKMKSKLPFTTKLYAQVCGEYTIYVHVHGTSVREYTIYVRVYMRQVCSSVH